MNKIFIFSMATALVLALNACGKKEEPRKSEPTPAPTSAPAPVSPSPTAGVTVSAITLGNAIDANKKVTHPADSFGKSDTIYASVDTSGAGAATLKAKWTYRATGQETLVKEDTQTIAPTGPAVSEFHISKPGGWPPGNYQVEIFVTDRSVGTKTFTVT
jgi:hypothetical protein